MRSEFPAAPPGWVVTEVPVLHEVAEDRPCDYCFNRAITSVTYKGLTGYGCGWHATRMTASVTRAGDGSG